MTTLAAQQQALLHAVLHWPGHQEARDNALEYNAFAQDASTFRATKNIAISAIRTGARGLKAYQSNGHALAERALAAAYPVVTQLLGGESLAALARAFWHTQPPTCGDIAQWGEGLATFIGASAQLAQEPYLADVARVEWALHTCASAADGAADPASLALLMTQDPAGLRLRVAPGCRVLASAWPVVSLINAHGVGHPSLMEAGQRVRDAVAETALVWRTGLRPAVREASAGEPEFTAALLAGQSLAQALDGAPALDFTHWLPQAVHTQLLLGVVQGEPTHTIPHHDTPSP